MFKQSSIRTKLLLVMTVLLLVTLGSTHLFWFLLMRPILIDRLNEAQVQLGSRAALQIEEFLQAKLRTLTVHSQTAAFVSADVERQKYEILTFFAQDQDLQKISVINERGQEVLKLFRNEENKDTELLDRSRDPSFLVPYFRYGQEYISPVFFTAGQEPHVSIAIPIILPKRTYQLTELSTSAPGQILRDTEVFGVLEIDISLQDLFLEIEELATSETGSIYIVDTEGNIIVHPDNGVRAGTSFLSFPPVDTHVSSLVSTIALEAHEDQPEQYLNHAGVPVVGTHVPVSGLWWGVVVEQSEGLALNELNRVTFLGTILLLVGIAVAAGMAFVTSRRFTSPIKKLVEGVQMIGAGNLSYRLHVKTGDEIEDLANHFNKMTRDVQVYQKRLETDRDIIQAERDKLAVVLAGVEDSVIALDKDLSIVLMNDSAEKLTGWGEEEIQGKPIDEVITIMNPTTNELIPAKEYCRTASAENSRGYNEYYNIQLVNRNEQRIDINIFSSPLRQENGADVFCILTIHNVSKEMELERMKLDFVSIAAHELRTPLTAVRGYLSLLKEPESFTKLNEEEQEFLNRSMVSVSNLGSLVDNLLNVSQIEKGQLEMDLKPVFLETSIQKVVEELTQTAKSKGLELTFKKPSKKTTPVHADQFRIEEVLRNLIGNAINYTQKGSITVSVEEENEFVKVIITDTGEGIPVESLPHLFEKFYRVQGELQAGSKGTGLGLFISKKIIEHHGGHIGVESQFGHGSTFYFTLPVSND